MSKRKTDRKTLTVDRLTADTIKDTARRHGMAISMYMKKLAEKVVQLEQQGIFVPLALDELSILHMLSKFGFAPIPIELVGRDADLEKARPIGVRVGSVLRELGVDVGKVVETLCRFYGIAVTSADRLIIVPSTESTRLLAELVKGIAIGGGLEVEESGGILSIKLGRS